MPYVNSSQYNTLLENSKCCVATMAGEYVDLLNIGSENAEEKKYCLRRQYYLTKGLEAGYIPGGTVLSTSLEAESTVDFSSFNTATLSNGMRIVITTVINSVNITVVNFVDDFFGFNLTSFLSTIAAEVNAGTSGFTASSDSTTITLTAPVSLGALPNGLTIDVLLSPRYVFTAAGVSESGAGVGSPGWAGIVYNPSDSTLYGANRGGSKKTYWWNGTGSVTSPPAIATNAVQCIATTGENRGIALSSNSNIYVGSSDFSPSIINKMTAAVGSSCGTPISGISNYGGYYALLFNPVDACTYFGNTQGSSPLGIYKMDEFGTFTRIPLGITTGPSPEYIYFPGQLMCQAAVDPYSGKVWVLGAYFGPSAGYGFAIVDGISGTPSSQVVFVGAAANLFPRAIVYASSTNLMYIITPGFILKYDLSGVRVGDVAYPYPVGSTVEAIHYDSLNDKIIISHSNSTTNVVLTDGSVEDSFTVPSTVSGVIQGFAETGSGDIYTAIANVSGSNLYLAKMSYISAGDTFSGTFSGGITGVVWDADDNCLPEESAVKMMEELKKKCLECDDSSAATYVPFISPSSFNILSEDGNDSIVDDQGSEILVE
jgi:hypothetical protein